MLKVILNPKPTDPVQCTPKNVEVNWEKRRCSSVNSNIKEVINFEIIKIQQCLQIIQKLLKNINLS